MCKTLMGKNIVVNHQIVVVIHEWFNVIVLIHVEFHQFNSIQNGMIE